MRARGEAVDAGALGEQTNVFRRRNAGHVQSSANAGPRVPRAESAVEYVRRRS